MRFMKSVWAIAIVACLYASAVLATSHVDNAALKQFLKESSAQYDGSNPDQAHYENQLYAWAKAGDGVVALQHKTADTFSLPAPAARRLVALTLERGALDNAHGWPTALVDRYIALLHDYPRSDVILDETSRTLDGDPYTGCPIDPFQQIIAGLDNPDAARLRIFDVTSCQQLLTERTTLRKGDTTSYVDMATRSDELSGDWLKLAILRIADSKIAHTTSFDAATRVDVRKRRVIAELDDGRLADALAALPASPAQWPALTQAFSPSERRSIAAAHYLRGDLARARAWLAAAAEAQAPASKEKSHDKYEQDIRDYQLALLNRALTDPKRDDFAFLAGYFEFRSGIEQQDLVWQEIVRRLAVLQGYDALIDVFDARDAAKDHKEALDGCYRCAPELTAMIDQIAASYVSTDPSKPAIDTTAQLPALVRDRMARVLKSQRPAWVEHAMPPGGSSASPVAKPGTNTGANADFVARPHQQQDIPWMKRLPQGELVRYVQQAHRIVAVTASQSLDPTGEISAGGYWISVSEDDGGTFALPLYTGLRMYEPYVVLPQSTLPMLDGDRLRLEVAVRKLDDAHVMLPPVSLPFLQKRDHVYVEATLQDLARDSDGDGLTDLAEWAMMLSPDVADTDGDGINDAADPLPHVAATDRRQGADAMAAGLNKIFGNSFGAIITTDARDDQPGRTYALGAGTDAYNAASTRFVAAPPAYFAGLSLKTRVIVLDPSQLSQLSAARGMSFATGITKFALSHDGNAALMVWSTGWAGGTYLLKRHGKDWDVQEIAGWIT